MPREDSDVIPIPDLEGIADPDDNVEQTQIFTIRNPEIVGIPQLDIYKVCVRCNARVEPLDPPLGRCSKFDCAMLQKYDRCSNHFTARVMFASGEQQYETLTATLSLSWLV